MASSKILARGLFILVLLTGLLAGFGAPSLQKNVKAATVKLAATNVVISEFRTRGTNGANDEFVEIYNPTNSPVSIGNWQLKVLTGTGTEATRVTITSGTNLLPGQYYLMANNTAGSGYSGSVTPDQTYTTGIVDAGGIALFDNLGTKIDSVGLNTTYTTYTETSPLADLSTFSPDGNRSYERKLGGASDSCQDNGDNSADFQLISPSDPQNSLTSRRLCGIAADLSLAQSVNNPTPTIGSNVVFTITVANSGPNDATNVTVKDLLPSGLTYVSNDLGAAYYDSSTGIWTVGTLINGASAMINITATVMAGGTKTNWAEVWSVDQVDPDSVVGNGSTTEDDDASATVTSPTTGTLNITNTANNANPNVGTNVVFTITVSNPVANPFNATNVSVAASLPSGLSYVSYSSTAGAYSGGVWTIGNLAIGVNATLYVTAKVTTTNPSPYSATVSSNEYLDSTATATINNPLSGEADLSLTHDPLVVSTSIADQVALKLRLHNAGPDTATGIQVKDLLPSGLDYVSYTSSTGTYSSSTGIWTVDTLASGTDATLTINVKVDSGGSSTQNFAEVGHSDQYDPDSTPANGDVGEDDNTSLEVPIADLSLAETVDVAGSNAIFTLTLKNSGPDDATNVAVQTSLPSLTSTYTFVSSGGTQGTYNSGTGIWTVGTLLDGASATLTITTTTSGSLQVNWVEASASDQVDPDSVPDNGSMIEDDDASAPAADLFLTQSVNNVNPDVNTNVVFTITVSNAGIAGTTNVQVKDLWPSGLTYVSYTSSTGAYSSSSGIWTVGTLASGVSQTLNITAKVAVNGIKTNWAEVWRSDASDPDSTPGNGSTTEDDDASATITSYRSIIINEIAWGGTVASANDEWIELRNPSSASINITGWTLKSSSGSLNITLSGTISAGGYFLLEREDNSTVSDISADQIYTGGALNLLSDSGEVLTLRDASSNFIDTANGNGGSWPKGSNTGNRGTMERVGTTTESDSTWVTNLGSTKNGKDTNNWLIYGTPRRANSTGSAPYPTALPYRTATPKPFGHLVINEFLPRPGFDWNNDGEVNVYDEFIEVENLGPVDVNLSGWKLDDEPNIGSNPYTLPSKTLKPGERAIFFGSQTHILLDDSGDEVRLINSRGVVVDARGYTVIKYPDQSICRIPDGGGYWKFPCFPTPGNENSLTGSVPSSPSGRATPPPACLFADTTPSDFVNAECHSFGADMWSRKYWDDQAGPQNETLVPDDHSKWQTFVE